MVLKTIVPSLIAKYFGNKTLHYSLVIGIGVFFIYFVAQVKLNHKEIIVTNKLFPSDPNVKIQIHPGMDKPSYWKKFNLMEIPTEVIGEECTLGRKLMLQGSKI